MKAENEDLKDELLSKTVNEGFKEEGISSNFTHQVMGKVNAFEASPKKKPLIAWWAWILIGGPILFGIVVAIIYAPMPEESSIVVSDEIVNTYNEVRSYLAIGTLILGMVLVDKVIRYRKKFAS